ncbi:MAG: HEAT repeat domain-containing protein [Halosimplex sp.]
MVGQNESDGRVEGIRRAPSDADEDDIEHVLSALGSEGARRRRSAALAISAVSGERPRALAEHVEELGDALDGGPQVRGQAVRAIADVATVAPERVSPVAEDLRVCLGIDADVTERSALQALTALAEIDSEPLVDLAPALCSVVQRGSNLEESLVRALALLDETLPEAADEVATLVPSLLDLLESVDVDSPTPGSVDGELEEFVEPDRENLVVQRASARKLAGVLLARVAAERPAAVSDRVDDLATFLDDSDVVVRKAAVDALHSVATADPATLADGDSVRTLADRLGSDEADEVRGRVAAILGTVTMERPEATLSQRETLVPAATALLDAEETAVRSEAVKLLASIAAVEPEAVSQAVPELRARLEDGDSLVRARALWALRDLQATEAEPTIRELAKDDPDPDVRALAKETLEEFGHAAR